MHIFMNFVSAQWICISCLARQASAPIQSVHGTLSLHEMPIGCCCPYLSSGHACISLPGHLVDLGNFGSWSHKLSVQMVLTLFSGLGLLVNLKKSHLVSRQTIKFIGSFLDSKTAGAFLPQERFFSICHFISDLKAHPQNSVRLSIMVRLHDLLYLCNILQESQNETASVLDQIGVQTNIPFMGGEKRIRTPQLKFQMETRP